LSAKSPSLASAICLISSLNRHEEVIVPSLPVELMKTAVPSKEVWPKTLPIKQLVLTFVPSIPTPDTDNVIRCVAAAGGVVFQNE
jgi:hypothetical protein